MPARRAVTNMATAAQLSTRPSTTSAPAAGEMHGLSWRTRMLGGCACVAGTTAGWITQAQLMHALGLSEARYAPAQFAYWIHVW